MQFQSALAIYMLFWTLTVFLVLPFGVRTAHEAQADLVPGQAESAPVNFSLKRVLIRTTIVSAILFGLFYLNYVYGWVTPEMLDWVNRGQ
jgi:predicted secreted protein